MGAVRFGVVLPNANTALALATEAEELDFDFVACGDHIDFYGPQPSALVVLAAVAGATSRIELVSSIVLLPLYPPAIVAKQASIVDVISEGRLILGIGVGGENPREFQACGVPVIERGARTNESLTLIKRLWTENDVTFAGRFWTMNGITMEPKPIRKPYPPIWIAGRKSAAIRRVIEYGNGWLPYMSTPEQVGEGLAKIAQVRKLADLTRAVMVTAVIDPSPMAARIRATEWLNEQYHQDFEQLVDLYAIHGNMDTCESRIRQYLAVGVNAMLFDVPIGGSLRMLAKLVNRCR